MQTRRVESARARCNQTKSAVPALCVRCSRDINLSQNCQALYTQLRSSTVQVQGTESVRTTKVVPPEVWASQGHEEDMEDITHEPVECCRADDRVGDFPVEEVVSVWKAILVCGKFSTSSEMGQSGETADRVLECPASIGTELKRAGAKVTHTRRRSANP